MKKSIIYLFFSAMSLYCIAGERYYFVAMAIKCRGSSDTAATYYVSRVMELSKIDSVGPIDIFPNHIIKQHTYSWYEICVKNTFKKKVEKEFNVSTKGAFYVTQICREDSVCYDDTTIDNKACYYDKRDEVEELLNKFMQQIRSRLGSNVCNINTVY
jgi:hypothetical protein